MRISRVGNESLAEAERITLWFQLSCCVRTSGSSCQHVQTQRRQGGGLPSFGFCQVREKHRVLGILAAGERWSGGCGWGEGCAGKRRWKRAGGQKGSRGLL